MAIAESSAAGWEKIVTAKLSGSASWAVTFSRLPISKVWKVWWSTRRTGCCVERLLVVAMHVAVSTTLCRPRLWR